MPKRVRRRRRQRKQTGGWLNRYDLLMRVRVPIILKKLSGEVDKVVQWRISQIIKEGGAEIERVGPKILRGAIEDLYRTPFCLLGNFGRRKLAQLRRRLKWRVAKFKK